MHLEEKIINELNSLHSKLENDQTLPTKEALKSYYSLFRSKFGPEVLSELENEELLNTMHLHGKESLIYWLEFNEYFMFKYHCSRTIRGTRGK